MRTLLTYSVLFALGCCFSVPVRAQKNLPNVYAMDATALANNQKRIQKQDEQLMPAFQELIKDADKAMKFGPVSVMEKTHIPPSGNKHDYMSLAPYFWPDPNKTDGLPYIRKDGQTNPEVRDYKDKDYLPKLCEYVNTLGLAYYFSGEAKYAEHAAKLLKVWFIDTATKMNPNLNFAQAIKGQNTGRGAGMIDTRHFVKMIDGMNLLPISKSWTNDNVNSMKDWFRDYLNWMQTSKNGVNEMNASNNHGSWYDAQRLSIALLLDSSSLAVATIQHAANRLDKQLDENGLFPREMERTISLHYSSFVMEALFTIAALSEKTTVDFWTLTTPNGKSLQKAFDTLKPYFTKEKEWIGQQIKPFKFEDAYPILLAGSKKYSCTNCVSSIKTMAGKDARKLRLNLLSNTDFKITKLLL